MCVIKNKNLTEYIITYIACKNLFISIIIILPTEY